MSHSGILNGSLCTLMTKTYAIFIAPAILCDDFKCQGSLAHSACCHL